MGVTSKCTPSLLLVDLHQEAWPCIKTGSTRRAVFIHCSRAFVCCLVLRLLIRLFRVQYNHYSLASRTSRFLCKGCHFAFFFSFSRPTLLRLTHGFCVDVVRAAERMVRLCGAPQRLLEQHQPQVSQFILCYCVFIYLFRLHKVEHSGWSYCVSCLHWCT